MNFYLIEFGDKIKFFLLKIDKNIFICICKDFDIMFFVIIFIKKFS